MPLTSEDVSRLNNRLSEIFERLQERRVFVTDLAKDVIRLALIGIVDEPSRRWPDRLLEDSESERRELYERALDGLPFHLMSLRQGIKDGQITIFDAINYSSQLSANCCLIRIPPDGKL